MQRYVVLFLNGERLQFDADDYILDENGIRFFTEGPEERIGDSQYTRKPTCEVGRVAPDLWSAITRLPGDKNGEAS